MESDSAHEFRREVDRLSRLYPLNSGEDMFRLITNENLQDQLLLPQPRSRALRESDLWDTQKEKPKPPIDQSLTKFDREIADEKD